MNWPQAQDYQEAVQNPQQVFADPELQQAEVVCNKLGLPAPYSGSAAVVYHLHTPDGGSHWAVKCFTRPVRDLQQRYRDISAHLHRVNLPFTVGFQYLEQGIYLHETWYPVLKMDWVEGQTFHQFLAERLEQGGLPQPLCPMWLKLAKRLVEAQVVHGDLQHGNVLWVPGSGEGRLALKLVDYDGMGVPELAGLPMTEQGHEAYQHPQREYARTVTPEMDRFSHLVIYGALRCLAVSGRALWERYHDGNNLLFKKEDFRSPGESALLQELWSSEERELRSVAGHVVRAVCTPLEEVPPLDALLAGEEMRPLTEAERRQVRELLKVPEGQGIGKSLAPPPEEAVYRLIEEEPAGTDTPATGRSRGQQKADWKRLSEAALQQENIPQEHVELLRQHLGEIQARAVKELQAGSAEWLRHWALVRFLVGSQRNEQRQHLLEMLEAAGNGLEAAARTPLGMELLRDWLHVASDPFDLPPPLWRLLSGLPPATVGRLPASGLSVEWRGTVLVPALLGPARATAAALLRKGDDDLLKAFLSILGEAGASQQAAVVKALFQGERQPEPAFLTRLRRCGGKVCGRLLDEFLAKHQADEYETPGHSRVRRTKAYRLAVLCVLLLVAGGLIWLRISATTGEKIVQLTSTSTGDDGQQIAKSENGETIKKPPDKPVTTEKTPTNKPPPEKPGPSQADAEAAAKRALAQCKAAHNLVQVLGRDLDQLGKDGKITELLKQAGQADLLAKLETHRAKLEAQATTLTSTSTEPDAQTVNDTVEKVVKAVWQEYREVTATKRQVYALCQNDPAVKAAGDYLEEALKAAESSGRGAVDEKRTRGSDYYSRTQDMLLKVLRFLAEQRCAFKAGADLDQATQPYRAWGAGNKGANPAALEPYRQFTRLVLDYVISEVIAFPWDPGTVKERAYQARLAAFWEKAGPLLHQAAEAKERVSVRKAVDVVAGAIGRHVEPAVPAGQPRADVAPLVLLAEILSDDMVQCSIEGGRVRRKTRETSSGQPSFIQTRVEELQDLLKRVDQVDKKRGELLEMRIQQQKNCDELQQHLNNLDQKKSKHRETFQQKGMAPRLKVFEKIYKQREVLLLQRQTYTVRQQLQAIDSWMVEFDKVMQAQQGALKRIDDQGYFRNKIAPYLKYAEMVSKQQEDMLVPKADPSSSLPSEAKKWMTELRIIIQETNEAIEKIDKEKTQKGGELERSRASLADLKDREIEYGELQILHDNKVALANLKIAEESLIKMEVLLQQITGAPEQVQEACREMTGLFEDCHRRFPYGACASRALMSITGQDAAKRLLLALWNRVKEPELIRKNPQLLVDLHQFLWSFLRYELEVRGEAQPGGDEITLMKRAFSKFRLEASSGAAVVTEILLRLVGQAEMKTIFEMIVDYYSLRATVTGDAAGKVHSRKALANLLEKLGKELPKLESSQGAGEVEKDIAELRLKLAE